MADKEYYIGLRDNYYWNYVYYDKQVNAIDYQITKLDNEKTKLNNTKTNYKNMNEKLESAKGNLTNAGIEYGNGSSALQKNYSSTEATKKVGEWTGLNGEIQAQINTIKQILTQSLSKIELLEKDINTKNDSITTLKNKKNTYIEYRRRAWNNYIYYYNIVNNYS